MNQWPDRSGLEIDSHRDEDDKNVTPREISIEVSHRSKNSYLKRREVDSSNENSDSRDEDEVSDSEDSERHQRAKRSSQLADMRGT